jgi:hypothetical protein
MEWALSGQVFSVGCHGVALQAQERWQVAGALEVRDFFGVVRHWGYAFFNRIKRLIQN